MKDLYSEAEIKTAKPESAGKEEKRVRQFGDAYRILIKPLVTEKAANLGSANKYVFAVSDGANKIKVAEAINEVYGIKPVSVNILNRLGKKVRYGRMNGRRKNWRKAIVTLPAGKSINIYEGV